MALLVAVVSVSVVDSVLLGYDSSIMGSLNVMPTYQKYFTLTTATKSLNTAISYVGGSCSALLAGFVVGWIGRWKSIMLSCVLTLIGAVIQTAAQNIGMFIAGRFIVGFGLGFAQTSCPTYVAETAPPKHRAVALGLYYACWGVGTLVASGVCYSTQHYSSTWAWRTPSLVQIIPSILCMIVLLFLPESPRFLIDHDRHDEALEVLAALNANGDKDSPVVLVQYREITDTIAWEKSQQLSWRQAFSTKANRKRIIITATFSIIVMLPGTNIITFYFGTMLSQAGITDPTTQLEINIILTSWTLVVSLVGAWYADSLGRKTLCVISLAGQIVTFFILAGLTAVYGNSTDKSGIYGTIAMIFLYNAAYAYGITPLTVLYPPEVLSYSLRSVGMGLYTLTTKLSGLLVTMAFPFALDAIGWKTYIINASADIVMMVGVIWYWVETRGLTLEEVDKVFDGIKHSDVPDLKAVTEGEVEVGSELLKTVTSIVENQEVVIKSAK
ncbi:uncharacterized protein Z520_12039 [Fonsecaea multimorphosa CBS 102226]|uniref:Major facilitator superfamily (MFS) profile domain-containing protein n=1 Tax=Fonsecaea multimorphosa CBS 102226 TaxID=1442371 RepID=A0A0D2K7G5_9EURO|nr:uncharacterized protein Z520_12039 [Fonsecaea multimorphosa CBS 102226]KIX92293.1 hypothetical protein Z520_12039 [Fonsecaea multimorphosa CBS 102226]OAL17663.1 hypothetical protein AYO22_11453 [Fonsecaea multimorphosa]